MFKTDEELLNYIKNRKYLCPFCVKLQKEVQEGGLVAIDNYRGMICSSIEDMKIRRGELVSGHEHVSIDIWDMI